MSWRSASIYADPENGGGPRQAEQRLVQAYREVFKDKSEAVEIVLADMAAHCRFYQVERAGVPGDDLNHTAGRRAAFMRILSFLALSDDELAGLNEAAIQEAAQTGA